MSQNWFNKYIKLTKKYFYSCGFIMKTKILMFSFALSLGLSANVSAISPCLAQLMACIESDAGVNERTCEAEYDRCTRR